MSDPDPDEPLPAAQSTRCSACSGSGRVISALGAAPTEVECPWCGGGGVRLADLDAQARWRK